MADQPLQVEAPQPTPPLASIYDSVLNPQFGIWALSHERDLEAIEHFLRGDRPDYDNEGGLSWQTTNQTPVLNEAGIYEVMRFLRGLTSKIITLAKVDEKQFYRDLLENCLTINSALFLNYRRYGLKPHNYALVCVELNNYIEYSFSKAKNGAFMDFVHPKHRSVENIITRRGGEQKQSGGFLGL